MTRSDGLLAGAATLLAFVTSAAGCESDDDPPGTGGSHQAGTAGKAGTGTGGGGAGAGGNGTAGSAGTGGGGAGGAAGAAGSGGSAAEPFVCPPGSQTAVLSLSGVTPSPLPGVPPSDGYATNANIEGPVWIAGALYVSQIRSGVSNPPPSRILKIVPGGEVVPVFRAAGTNGLALDERGALLGAVHADGSISRFDLNDPEAPAVPIVSRFSGKRFNSPNDLAVRSDGTLYFSDPDWQSADPELPERAYRVRPSGSTAEVIGRYHAGEGALAWVAKPNGVTLSRDERTLYIGGTGGLYRFEVAADGAVATGEPVAAISGGVDGMTKDCAGNLYVTNGQKVVVLGPDDAFIGDIALTGTAVTNVAFGGSANKTLYVTSMGNPPRVHRVDLNVPGYPY